MPHFDLGEDGGVAESIDVPGESLGSQLASAEAGLSARNDEGATSNVVSVSFAVGRRLRGSGR